MTIRRAIKRKQEIVAECPKGGGVCRWAAGGREWFSCCYYSGSFDNGGGLMVRCSCPDN